MTACKRTENNLEKRANEPSCLREIGQLISKTGTNVDELLKGMADLILRSSLDPEITCAKITLGDKEFKTDNFKTTQWKQSADINIQGRKEGAIEVYYLAEKPEGADGVFSKLDRILIDGAATMLGKMVECKHMEEQLRKSENRFRELVISLPEIIYEIDAEGNLTFANDIAFDASGYSREDFDVGLNAYQMFIPEEREKLKDNITRIMSGEKLGPNEYMAQRKDGSRFPVIVHSSVITDDQGNPVGLRGIVMDITERKRAEDELARVIEGMLEAVGIMDLDGTIRQVNSEFERGSGWKREEVIGKKATELGLMCKEEGQKVEREVIPKLMKEGSVRNTETIVIRRDGTKFPGLMSWILVKDAEGKPTNIVVVTRDITERKRGEHELKERVKELNCVYGIVRIAERPDITLDELYQEVADLLPEAWQYPEIACARIIIDNKAFQTENYRETEWKQSSDIIVREARAGVVDICYLEERPEIDEGMFSKEERRLIDTVAGRLGRITERKQAEEALRESRERASFLADVLERSSQPWAVRYPDGRFVTWNAAYCRLLGYSNEELHELKWSTDLTPREWREVVAKVVERIGATGQPQRAQKEYIRKDGSRVPVEAFAHPFFDSKGNLQYYYSFYTDITERKQAEKALEESEKRYRSLFERASDSMITHDLEGNIIEANHALSELTGYRVDELVRMNISEIYTPESFQIAMEKQQKQLKGEATSKRCELELIRADGTKAIADAAISLVISEGQPVAVHATARDITELKRWRDNIQFYISETTRAQEEERKRIARELHDATVQDLAVLSLEIDALARAKERLSEGTLQQLEKLRERIDSIVEEIRHFSSQLRPGVLDQVGLVPALELLTDDLRKQGGINGCVEVIGSERRLSPDSELVLFRIAQEALQNVRRHSQATEVVVRVEFGAEKVRLDVTDNGTGFEVAEVLGDFASRGKLGLIGMQERARLLDGNFSLKSGVGKGTTISVEVPG